MISGQRIETLKGLDLVYQDRDWPFAAQNRAEIMLAWEKRILQNPSLWNGEVLIAQDVLLTGNVLSARLSRTDYASFVVWRDWGWPDTTAFNLFGMGAMMTTDGALVFGEMSSHTLNPGMIYPPGGSLEPTDVRPDGMIDIDNSICKEISEETGLDVSQCDVRQMFAVYDGQRLAVVKILQVDLAFGEVEAVFAQHNGKESQPELVRLVPMRSMADVNGNVPSWAVGIAQRILDDR